MDINVVTNPQLYRACPKFFDAGYEQRHYPRPLNTISASIRGPLRRAYREGRALYSSEVRLAHVLYGI